MNKRFMNYIAVLIALIVLTSGGAYAQGMVSTTVVMRVSRMTQNAVVDAGEDLSMEVNIEGVAPTQYQWYFEDAAIEGANQKVYNIVNASVEDTGSYRLDAFDANGSMVVSMDIAARVIEDVVPQSGDASMPVSLAFAGMVACVALLIVLLRRRAMA